MSRNSRLWQDSLAHATIYEGDVGECAKWLGYAKQKLQFMLHNTAGALTATFNPALDVTVRVDTRPNRIYISAGSGLYLESGFYDLRSYARCAENTYRPAILNYNPRILAYAAQSPNWWQGQVKIPQTIDSVEGQDLQDKTESLSVGCNTKLPEVSALYPCDKTYRNDGYCEPDRIFKKKTANGRCPASKFSGKLRLYVQSLYGSKRDDYRMLVDQTTGAVLDPESLIIGAVELRDGEQIPAEYTLSSQFSKANGLFTTEDYRYYLIEVGSFVRYYPLRLSAPAEKLRSLLIGSNGVSDADRKRVEAYILSTAVVDKSSAKDSGAVSVTGKPLYYGWHWSNDGSEGDIVCHSEDNVNQWYVARHFKLRITYDSQNDRFFHQLSTEETSNWWVVNGGHVVYTPLPFTGQMMALPLVANTSGTFSGNPSYGTFDATIYVFRSDDDTLIPVSVSNSTITDTSTVLVNNDNPNGETQGCFTGPLLHLRSITYSGIQGMKGISVGDVSQNIEYKSSSVETEVTSTLGNLIDPANIMLHQVTGTWYPTPLCVGGTLESYLLASGLFDPNIGGPIGKIYGAPFTATLGGTVYTDCHLTTILGIPTISRFFERESWPLGRYYTGSFCVIVPYNSCSGVYVGARQIKQDRMSNHNSAELGGFLARFDFYTATYSSAFGGTDFSTAVFLQEGPWAYVTPTLSYNPVIPDNFDTPPDTETNRYDVNVSGNQEVISTEAPSSERFFEVDWFDYPFLDVSETVRDNTSGEYKYNSGWAVGLSGEDGYEGDSSVGWS